MEPDVLSNIQKVLEELVEEKIQTKSQIEKLNKIYTSRENTINEFINMYHEAKTLSQISQAKKDLAQVLLCPSNTDNPSSKNENIINKTQENDDKIKAFEKKNDKNKELESYKKTIKKFKKSMAKLAKDIHHELDIFSVCFAADVESLYLKMSQLEEKPKVIKSKVLVSDVIVSENIEEEEKEDNKIEEKKVEEKKVEEKNDEIIDSLGVKEKEEKKVEEKNDEIIDSFGEKEKTEILASSGEIINFSRISFGGIKKKPKPHKK
ncbi:hypothetical protein SteCoe_10868 [Stentor coeruleus]|uniref:Uncharacterized protein n=1 Tax=Stentor coeruleus TaxID=5963 RepID=A0A1R2CEJ7_9CILI|nr:hypothetical protein SteCoe_10868 [Stentor coeruleus]